MNEKESKKMTRVELDRMLDAMITSIANATSIGMSPVDIKQKIYHTYGSTIYGAMGIPELAESQIPVLHDTGRNGGIAEETGWPLSFIAHADFGTMSKAIQEGTQNLKGCITHFDILDAARGSEPIAQALNDGLPSYNATVMQDSVYRAVVSKLYEEENREFLRGQFWVISDEAYIDDTGRDAYLHCYLLNNVSEPTIIQVISGVICFHEAFDDYSRPTYKDIELLLSTRFVQNQMQTIYTDAQDLSCIQYMSNYYYEWKNYLRQTLNIRSAPLMSNILRFEANPSNRLGISFDYFSEVGWRLPVPPKRPIVFVSWDVLDELDNFLVYCVPDPSIFINQDDGKIKRYEITQLIRALDNMIVVGINMNDIPRSGIRSSNIFIKARRYRYKVNRAGNEELTRAIDPGDVAVLGSFSFQNVVLSIDRTVVLDIIKKNDGDFAANGEDIFNAINAFYIGWNADCTRLKPIVYTSFPDFMRDVTW